MQASLEPMQLPLDECMWTTSRNRAAATAQLCPVRPANTTSDRCPTYEQNQHSNRSDWWPQPVRPVHNRAQICLETTWKPSRCIQ
jgi:hypothetical protein